MILTLQQGGGIPPLLNYTILNPQSVSPFNYETKESGKSKEKDEDELLEILKYVKDLEFLPNDSAYITQEIQSLLDSRASGYPIKQKHIDRIWSKVIQMLNPGRHHATQFQKVYDKANSNGSLSEFAITPEGQLVGTDSEGNLKKLTIQQAQSGDYNLLSNSELLDLNSGNSSFTFDQSLLRIVENGVSWSKINELIKDAAMQIGNAELTQSGYTVKMAQDLQAGLEIAKEYAGGLPLQGLYKSKILTQDQTQQAMFALNYIYNALPENAKTLMKLKLGDEKTAKEHIFNRLGAQFNPKFEFDTNLELDSSGKKPGTQNNTDDKLPDLTEVEKWLYGYGFKEQFNLVGGTSDAITFTSTVLSMTDKGNPIGQTTLQKAIGGDFNGVLDTRYVTMGNQVIDTNALDKVILKDGRIYKVELPLNMELYNQGIIAPDYNYSRNKEAADLEIKEKGITDKQEINAIYEKHNLPIKYDEKGEVITTHYATFGALHAVAMDKAFLQDKSDLDLATYLNEISDEKGVDNILSIYKRLNGISDKDKSTSGWDYNDWGAVEGDYDAFYEGILYIPVQAHFANAKVGQSISPSQMTELQQMQTVSDTSNQLKTVGWNDRK